LRRLDAIEKWHLPRPRTSSPMRIADVRCQRASLLYDLSWAWRLHLSRRCRRSIGTVAVAPHRVHELAIDTKAHRIAREVIADKSGHGIIHIGNVVVDRILVGIQSLEVVGALLAAISDLPGLLVVVGRDRGGGPNVSVARNFPAVVKVIENS